MKFIVIIPARYNSGRLAGKPLIDLHGKSMIQRVYEQACKSSASEVIIATDDERISSTAKKFNAKICMTNVNHPSGTDRLQEVVEKMQFADQEIIVNVQGDEPFIPYQWINQVAGMLYEKRQNCTVGTLSCPIKQHAEIFNPAIVKVVTDKSNNALYFSRAPLPWDRNLFPEKFNYSIYQRHIGIYAYFVQQLHEFIKWGVSPLESIECLEQLRFLWHGRKIHVSTMDQIPREGIDTYQDVKNARAYLQELALN